MADRPRLEAILLGLAAETWTKVPASALQAEQGVIGQTRDIKPCISHAVSPIATVKNLIRSLSLITALSLTLHQSLSICFRLYSPLQSV